jgi:hypothetical protein
LLNHSGFVCLAAVCLLPVGLCAQSADPVAPAETPASAINAAGSESTQIDKRIFGVLPNYRTADGSAPFVPIDTKRKFYIAFKDSFDYPVYPLAGAFAALYQLENQNPSYGQGLKGYAKRFASAYGDQAIGNLMTEGIVPSLLHQDPRYFRKGEGGGSGWQRTRYALTRVFVARNDSGKNTFNYAEWLGNGAAVAISNTYYPSDTRTVSDNVEKLLVQVSTDAFSQILKEFWPDWKRKFFKKKS